ncbi:unnamed protein product [Clonostachys solani]|uniref:Fe2OG dioxygenase domain-containing protein n=1 Tax=Clonostachys solani TaxID=160281 RepID=A0A9N9ZBE9_9HYPO|nr:unnamed protein product [Clonostachys solani]
MADQVRLVRQLDFSKFLAGDPTEKSDFCREFVHDLSQVGFVKLTNHGIPPDQIRGVFHWNQQFFSLPSKQKSKAAHPAEANPHRGYSYVGQEKLSMVKDYEKGTRDAMEVMDIKESFDQGPKEDELYPNRWPDEQDLPGFRSFMEIFYDSCHEVHLNILRAIETGMDLRPAFLQDLCRVNTSELRINHYPATDVSALRKGAMRISEHTDFGTVTLLFQDSVGGLEVEDQANTGRYFPVLAEDPDEIIINIGDCLQRWTNERLRSTSHRVLLPPGAGDWIPDRYSVAYFAKPNRTQTVGPLPEFLKEGEVAKYDNITAWQYNQLKLLRTY